MKIPHLRIASSLVIFLLTCLPAALANNGHHGGNSNVSVTISPGSASLPVGQSQQFTASVSGTWNKGVNWLVNGVLGGNAAVGTVSFSGVYLAPATAPSSPVLVTAQSTAQPTASATASVTISASSSPSASVSVSVSPSSTSVQVGQSQAFSSTVSGTSNTAVNWLVNGSLGGNSTYGTISSSGVYTAPAAVPASSVTVTAQSAAQSTATGNATVSLMPATVSVSISPVNASLIMGQSQQFSASVSGTSNTALNWLVNGVLGGNSAVGTVSSSGLYTAPTAGSSSSVQVTAQSAASVSSSASASVTVTSPLVSLSWSDAGSNIAGYNVYRGTQSPGPFAKINPSLDTGTTYTDNAVTAGQTYYYVTTAVDTSGVESSYSNVAQASIP